MTFFGSYVYSNLDTFSRLLVSQKSSRIVHPSIFNQTLYVDSLNFIFHKTDNLLNKSNVHIIAV